MKTFVRVLGSLVMLAASSLAAQAQDWPSKPIRMIVPFAPGGSTDVAARLVAEYLSRSLGQQVVVENRTGANGNIGTEAAAKSAPDGYTILVAPDSMASNPHVYKVAYELKDLTPVIQLSRQPIVLAAHPTLGVKTIAELVAHAKNHPGERFATGSGTNSGQHMVTPSLPASSSSRSRIAAADRRSTICSPVTSSSARSARRRSFRIIGRASSCCSRRPRRRARRACRTCRPFRRPA
jgi:tripartite-type tricarboxylate transporter receptor subunit TctC